MTRDIVDSIDHALSDWQTSPDAMRWAPHHEGEVTLTIDLDLSGWDAAVRGVAAAMADVDWERIRRLLADIHAAEFAERAPAMRADYDRRRRARLRRRRR